MVILFTFYADQLWVAHFNTYFFNTTIVCTSHLSYTLYEESSTTFWSMILNVYHNPFFSRNVTNNSPLNSNRQWRRLELAMQMLTFCPSLQTPYPGFAVRPIIQALLHDDIAVRRTAQRLTHYILKQRKHKLVKVKMDPYEIAGVPRPVKHVPGEF